MNLGQMLLVIGAMVLLGILVLNANSTVFDATDTMYTSEFGVTAVSLATSIAEEAMGKMYDQIFADTTLGGVFDSSAFTPPSMLGPDAGESYRKIVPATADFNDFDDFNGLKICYHSDVPADADSTAGYYQFKVPGMRAKYYVQCVVEYVEPPNLDVPCVGVKSWNKKITVVVTGHPPGGVSAVTDPSATDSLAYSAVMSYWN